MLPLPIILVLPLLLRTHLQLHPKELIVQRKGLQSGQPGLRVAQTGACVAVGRTCFRANLTSSLVALDSSVVSSSLSGGISFIRSGSNSSRA